jgi:hypothetical protein
MTNDRVPEQDTVPVVNFLQFVGAGWHTTGDTLKMTSRLSTVEE